jgi:murein DD-endopeptidase MepM/ murein hydrolase activator NlpD
MRRLRRLSIAGLAIAVAVVSPSSASADLAGKASRLRAAVAGDSQVLAELGSRLGRARSELASIERRLTISRGRLEATRASLRRERAHLAALEARLKAADQALEQNLISTYKTGRPDAITVLMEAHGFADLLDRIDFLRRFQNQDVRIVTNVKTARTEVIREAIRLGAVEARQQRLTEAIQSQRDQAARLRLALAGKRSALERDRAAKAAALRSADAKLRRSQAAVAGGGGGSGGGVMSGGGFTFPMPSGAASPPGSWTNDQGVDVSAPGHTPLLAVGDGTVVLHGIGGFGPSAPVLHLDSGSYVYYGHAGPGNAVAVGTHVHAGQAISEVGAGIVGISTGPHLEIGFANGSGNPIGPGTAPRMHALLLAAYGG